MKETSWMVQSSSSSSWRVAFNRSLPPLRSSARTVYPLPAAEPRSLWHLYRADLVNPGGGWPTTGTSLHSCHGRSPSLALVQILRIWLVGTVCEFGKVAEFWPPPLHPSQKIAPACLRVQLCGISSMRWKHIPVVSTDTNLLVNCLDVSTDQQKHAYKLQIKGRVFNEVGSPSNTFVASWKKIIYRVLLMNQLLLNVQ